MNNKATGIIGLGTMGGAICRRLLKKGHEILAFDLERVRLKEATMQGASPASSSAEIAGACDVILVVVENDSQVRDSIAGEKGVINAVKAGTTVIIHSTVHPETCQYCASVLAARGVKLLDAAMSGGETGIGNGILTLMVGGELELLDNYRALLGIYSDKIFHMGGVGMGMATKLCNNVILHANRLALYEAIKLAKTAGIDPQNFIELVKVSSGRSWVTERWEELDFMVLSSGVGEHPMVRQMKKDLSLALKLSRSLGISMQAAELADQQLPDLVISGLFSK
jgi:3-hydroxyisobutyrate dehydrogenase-like beta-hydroxyacid dehydrogenase